MNLRCGKCGEAEKTAKARILCLHSLMPSTVAVSGIGQGKVVRQDIVSRVWCCEGLEFEVQAKHVAEDQLPGHMDIWLSVNKQTIHGNGN